MTHEEFIKQNAASYTNEYAKFPYELIKQHHFRDADDSVASLINEINDLKNRGLFNVASKKIVDNADILVYYSFCSENINTYEEEIRNVQVMAKQKHQCVYVQESENDEPDIICVGDILI